MKSTRQDFEQFVAHCKWWLRELSLGQYCFAFEMAELDHDAMCSVNDEMMALITLSSERQGYHPVPMLARHEMLEVLVDESFTDMYGRFDPEYIQEKRHRLIHRLEKMLSLPTDKEVGFVGKRKPKGPKGC